MEHEVFISYSSNDKAIADAICHVLEHHGITCWIAPRDVRPGEPYAREIISGIKNCQLMILVFTSNSNSSPHVGNEIDMAFNNGKTIIPFLVDDTPMNEELKYYLARKHWLVAYPDYEKRFEELLTAVNNVLGRKLTPITRKIETLVPKEKNDEMVYLKILSNMDCQVLVDCKEVGVACANTLFKIPLRRGEYYVQFISLNNNKDSVTVEILLRQDVLEKVDLKGIRIKRENRELYEKNIVPYISNGKVGFINEKDKKIVIPCMYYMAFKYRFGLALVCLDKKYGFVDLEGNRVIPLIYDDACSFSEELAFVKQNGKWGCIDIYGNEIIPFKYDYAESFSEELAFVRQNGKYGYIDRSGKEIIHIKYDDAYSFTEGLAAVKINGKWGYIDKYGKEVIPFKYNDAYSFTEGLAAVEINGKWGYIDKYGKEVIPFKYGFARSFSEGLASVYFNGKEGYIDKQGNEVIPIKYQNAYSFSEGLASVRLNYKWGYIDKSGNEVISLQYDGAKDFSEGMAAVKLIHGRWGYINKSGIEITPFKYLQADSLTDGIAGVNVGTISCPQIELIDKFGNDTFSKQQD